MQSEADRKVRWGEVPARSRMCPAAPSHSLSRVNTWQSHRSVSHLEEVRAEPVFSQTQSSAHVSHKTTEASQAA